MFRGCSPLCSVPPPPPDSTHSCLLLSPPTVSRWELHPAVSLLSFSSSSSFTSLLAIFNTTHFLRDPVTPSRDGSSRHPRAPSPSLPSCLLLSQHHFPPLCKRARVSGKGGGRREGEWCRSRRPRKRPAPFWSLAPNAGVIQIRQCGCGPTVSVSC